MPGKVKVRILSGRNLPIMDRSAETTDAFAEVKFSETTFKTEVFRKSLNPEWNSDWFRFHADDRELQDEPLQIRVMDYDTYSANDAIGKVYVDLNPLLLLAEDSSSGTMSGWLPIFDTMQGLRGEIKILVKVELFSDLNKFRQSSCGVQFYCSSGIPEGFQVVCINGFVEELVVNDDPEYQWIDKIRTPRASNEARQSLFMKLSGAVQRKIGLKALELGANAVVGYHQRFDFEGDTGIVVRGIGTAVTLQKPNANDPPSNVLATICPDSCHVHRSPSTEVDQVHNLLTLKSSTGNNYNNNSNVDQVAPQQQQQNQHCSPDSESGSPPPRGTLTNSINSIPTIPYASKQSMNRHGLAADSLEFLEYPFITMTKFPPGFLFHLGGFVSTRSVKLLDDLEEDSVTRDGWWQEIRREIRSHARALGCSIIVGYSEEITIWEDVVVLYASGTAALGNMRMMLDLDMAGNFGPPFIHAVRPLLTQVQSDHASNCKLYHVPYAEGSLPFPVKMTNCAVCGRKKVPDVLITTIEPSNSSDFVGRGSFIQAKVVKYKKDLKGDNNAKEISDALPFLEYEIHRQLLNKLKVKGMNSLFDLKIKISISSRLICAIASATSVFTSALPIPDKPRLLLSSSSDDKHKNTSSVLIEKDHLDRTTKRLEEKVSSNILHYDITSHQIKSVLEQGQTDNNVEEVPDRENEEIEVDFSAGNKDACVLEIDDSEDADILNSLLDPLPPKDFYIYSTEEPVGIPPGHIITSCQTFTQVWRGKVHPTSKEYGIACQNLLSLVYFKLRSFRPCLICKLNFQLNYDDENEMQIILNGTAISIDNSSKTTKKDDSFFSSSSMLNGGGNSMIFNLECDSSSHNKIVKPCRFYVANKEGQGVNVTPLSYIPGARIERYMGNLNFFLIRETSSLRESGGLNTFIQSFINEFYGIVRAHVYALGGNGLVAFFMSEFVLSHSLHKNQAQCLIHVGGDVVSAHYTTLTL
nr:C2 domain-containing protein 5-like isoform X5 [Lepeophtheirus salmonis]